MTDAPSGPRMTTCPMSAERFQPTSSMRPVSAKVCAILVWLQASFIRWAKEDDSARNREWIEGIAVAFQESLAGEL